MNELKKVTADADLKKLTANDVLDIVIEKLNGKKYTELEWTLGDALRAGQTDVNTICNQLTVGGYKSKYKVSDKQLKKIVGEIRHANPDVTD